MSNTLLIPLPNIKQNTQIFWNTSSQTASACRITLSDSSHTYFSVEKQQQPGDGGLTVLSNGNALCTGIGLTLQITGLSMKNYITGQAINPNGAEIGYTYTVCIEDWDDNDFNDLVITVFSQNITG